MVRSFVRIGVALLLAALWPQPALAGDLRPGCWATTEAVMARGRPEVPSTDRWICDGSRPQLAQGTSWLFFTAADFAPHETQPDSFVTDIGIFARIHLVPMNASGPLRTRTYLRSEVTTMVNGPKFVLPLPDMAGATGLVVAVERPWSPMLLSQAQLQARHDASGVLGWSQSAMVLIALVVGLLATPMFYNVALYRILREPFVLWMLTIQAATLVFVAVSSGLVHHFVHFGVDTLLVISYLTAFAPIMLSAGFTLSYLDPGRRNPRLRSALAALAVGTALAFGVVCLSLPFTPLVRNSVLLAMPLPLIVMLTAVALANVGERAGGFLLAGCGALIMFGIGCLLRIAAIGVGTMWPDVLLYGSLLAHVAIGSLAVMDRVDIMRRERARVDARIETLTNLIDLDPLTGLFNRRALEQRFADLRSQGYHALAVVDLDHFKKINDRFGHTTGDRVLQEVGAVLASDRDACAFRMGGEEFVIMLRGANIQQRAEQMRRAISIRIANEIEGVEVPVTASMGMIESPPGGASSMRHLYGHADRLLYEAKFSGRNRMISERVHVFEPPARERRMADRRAGPEDQRKAG